MEGNNTKKSKWFKILLFFFFLILSILLYSRYIETTSIIVKENKVVNSNVPEAFYGYKVVQLSDIHYKTTIGREELENIVKKVNRIKPDIVIISGDLLDSNTNYTDNDINNIIKILNNVDCEHKYIITGEDDLNDLFSHIIEKVDFKLLDNTYDIIYNGDYSPILVGGLSTMSDDKNANEKVSDIEDAISTYDTKYNILIIHEPAIIEDINYSNYQLVLAGHTHNGQINIPGIKSLFMPDSNNSSYTDTYYKKDNTDLYISTGLGTTKIKARLFNKPTINLYRLVNK